MICTYTMQILMLELLIFAKMELSVLKNLTRLNTTLSLNAILSKMLHIQISSLHAILVCEV